MYDVPCLFVYKLCVYTKNCMKLLKWIEINKIRKKKKNITKTFNAKLLKPSVNREIECR